MEEAVGKQKGKIVFCTNVSDEYYHSMGADKLVRSAKYFHPDIPFVVFGSDDVENIGVPHELNTPFIINKLMDDYEWVVRFDADSMIVGPLTELMDAIADDYYDVIGVRNNNDFDKAGVDAPFTQHNVGIDGYLNTGLIATKSQAFLDIWMDDNLAYGMHLPFVGQSTYNNLTRKFKTYIVDGRECDCYYGTSGLYGNDTHWDSWKDIEVIEGRLHLGEKIIKVLHHAGGFKPDKLGFYMFNKETRKRLIEIIS